jgi:hypothetical protein
LAAQRSISNEYLHYFTLLAYLLGCMYDVEVPVMNGWIRGLADVDG